MSTSTSTGNGEGMAMGGANGAVARAAEDYIRRGFAVTPAYGKVAYLPDWQNTKITLEEVPKFFSSGVNVGIVCGELSGWLVDIDLDTEESVVAARRFLPETLESGRVSRPRSHRWYFCPEAQNLDLTDLDGKKIIEIRGTGRQTIVPPSVHLEDGDNYVWHNGDAEIARVDKENLERRIKLATTATIIARCMVPVGGRHHYALALAGFMLRRDRLDEETCRAVLEAAWEAADADGKKALKEIRDAVEDSAEKLRNGEAVTGGPTLDGSVAGLPEKLAKLWGWPAGEDEAPWPDPAPLPEGLPPVEAFDPDLLPDALREWAVDVAERMQAPLDFIAIPLIVVSGSLVGRRIGILPKRHDDWLVVPNVWGTIVGRPALLKSPALAEAMKPLNRLASKAYEEHEEEQKHHNKEFLVAEAMQKAVKDELRSRAKHAVKKGETFKLTEFAETEGDIEMPEEPTVRRYKTEDTTVEKLVEILLENPHGLLVHRDKLSGWLKSLDKQGREGDRALYLESWNGSGSFDVDRIGRGSQHVRAVCLSILGSIQPGPLSQYVYQATRGGGGDDGLLQRFQLVVWPDPPKGWRNVDRPPNARARDRAYQVFEELDALVVDPPEDGQEIPALRFTEEAQAVFDEWRDKLEELLRSGDLTPPLEAHLAKYRSLMPSLALLFELIDSGGTSTRVGKSAALKAAAWCKYLRSHAKRLHSSAEAPEMAGARTLLRRIREGDLAHNAKVRDVYLRGWSGLSTPAETRSALDVLEAHGWLRVQRSGTGKRGRPSEVIELHPTLRERQVRFNTSPKGTR